MASRFSAIAVMAVTVLMVVQTRADVPAGINYQGRLINGTNLVNGTKTFTVRMYDAAAAGNLVYGETNTNVTVQDGLYTMTIGDEPGFSLALTNATLYMELEVDSQILTPREQMKSVAYAMMASRVADGAINADMLADGVLASNHIDWAAMPAGLQDGDDVGITVEHDPVYANDKTTIVFDGDAAAGDLSGTYPNPQIATGTIVNADIHAAAAISGSKVESGTTNSQGTVKFAAGANAPYLAIDDSDRRLNGYMSVNTLTATSPTGHLSIVGGTGVTVTDKAPNTVVIELGNLKLDNAVWVAVNGTPAGPGTYDSPFNDPQLAYNAAVAAYPTQPAVVAIAGGTYPLPLQMTAGNIHVQGFARPEIASLNVVAPLLPFVNGKVRVQGIVVLEPAVVQPSASGVKFHNCRFHETMSVLGSDIEFQDCQISATTELGGSQVAALAIGMGLGMPIRNIGVYNSAIQWNPMVQAGMAALLVREDVFDLEINGCEIVSLNPVVPAIHDLQPTPFLLPSTLHLFCHNYIKGPAADSMSIPAVIDTVSSTIAFHHNVVYGHVGLSMPVNSQFVTHCAVYGSLRWNLAGSWQTKTGMNMDQSAGEPATVNLPDPWDD